MEAVSFDYVRPAEVIEKANQWSGRLVNLNQEDFQMTSVVAPPQGEALRGAYEKAVAILKSQEKMRAVLREDEAGQLLERIRQDVAERDSRE